MNSIKFIDSFSKKSSEDVLVAQLSNIKNVEELLQELSSQLAFPSYFGFNWDALADFFADFHWVKETTIVIVHEDVPLLTEEEMYIYLEIILNGIDAWRDRTQHRLEVIFPTALEPVYRKIEPTFFMRYRNKYRHEM